MVVVGFNAASPIALLGCSPLFLPFCLMRARRVYVFVATTTMLLQMDTCMEHTAMIACGVTRERLPTQEHCQARTVVMNVADHIIYLYTSECYTVCYRYYFASNPAAVLQTTT